MDQASPPSSGQADPQFIDWEPGGGMVFVGRILLCLGIIAVVAAWLIPRFHLMVMLSAGVLTIIGAVIYASGKIVLAVRRT